MTSVECRAFRYVSVRWRIQAVANDSERVGMASASDEMIGAVMQTIIAGVVLACLSALNLWATYKVLQDQLSTRGQQAAQVAITWLLPVIGGLLVIRLKRDQLEPPSGKYNKVADPGDDYGLSARPDWHARGGHDETAASSSDAPYVE